VTDVKASLSTGGTFTSGAAYLLGDNGGSPGSLLATFDFPTVPVGAAGVETFTPISSVTLTAGANYWFALGNRDTNRTGVLNWANTNSEFTSGPSGPGSLGDFDRSADDGATWGSPFAGLRTLIEVDGTPVAPAAVPEPSPILAVAAATLAALGVWARRRRAASRAG
jgi:hypothetical protein